MFIRFAVNRVYYNKGFDKISPMLYRNLYSNIHVKSADFFKASDTTQVYLKRAQVSYNLKYFNYLYCFAFAVQIHGRHANILNIFYLKI